MELQRRTRSSRTILKKATWSIKYRRHRTLQAICYRLWSSNWRTFIPQLQPIGRSGLNFYWSRRPELGSSLLECSRLRLRLDFQHKWLFAGGDTRVAYDWPSWHNLLWNKRSDFKNLRVRAGKTPTANWFWLRGQQLHSEVGSGPEIVRVRYKWTNVKESHISELTDANSADVRGLTKCCD